MTKQSPTLQNTIQELRMNNMDACQKTYRHDTRFRTAIYARIAGSQATRKGTIPHRTYLDIKQKLTTIDFFKNYWYYADNNKKSTNMKTIDYSFRKRLNNVLGGFGHNYCYQCGACVADCPSHRHMEAFNPRTIILKALFGFEDELIGSESMIWNCTNCYNCHERCPQEVSPIEVIIALKNLSIEKETNPPVLQNIVDRVRKSGSTVSLTDLAQKRRVELDLPPYKMDCVDEVEKLLK